MDVEVGEETWVRLAAAQPAGRLVLRNVRRGDRLGSRKLKEIFIDRKIPSPDRRRIPILVRRSELAGSGDADEILWFPEPPLTSGVRVR